MSLVRTYAGVLIKDLPLYAVSLLGRRSLWLGIHNRAERLEPAPDGSGFRCMWEWTSDLHAPKVIPALGRLLMKCAFEEYPIQFADIPQNRPGTEPQISFIIGHRGTARLPHLLMTLQTIAGQRNVSLECIVVEQSLIPEIKEALPKWARYFHTSLPQPDLPYCRSWAFNVGARLAKADLLVFHDNDMLLPHDYAGELISRFREGYEVINLKRFIFYLNENHSRQIMAVGRSLQEQAPLTVVQNLEAGGSLAVSKDAFFAIGGFDESFVGWGGEDNEFWERAQTKRVWLYGYLPLIHLWHAPQPGKVFTEAEPAKELDRTLSQISPEKRIRNLLSRPFGRIEGPVSGGF